MGSHGPEPRAGALQLLVSTAVHQPALLQQEDGIALLHRAQSMGDEYDGLAVSQIVDGAARASPP